MGSNSNIIANSVHILEYQIEYFGIQPYFKIFFLYYEHYYTMWQEKLIPTQNEPIAITKYSQREQILNVILFYWLGQCDCK